MGMTRRDFAGMLAASGGLARAAGQEQAAEAARVNVTVHLDRPMGTIAPDFMGLGYEISSVARPGLLRTDNRVYAQLVRTLGARGVIRVGGNTSDFARYDAAAAPVSSPSGTVVNEAMLRDLGGFLKATGWKLIWGFDLGKGSEADALAEAKALVAAAGEHLLAVEIGNEPDLFTGARHRPAGYGYAGWLAEYRRYKAALRREFPRLPFAGPDAAGSSDWVTRFAADEGKDAVLLTQHYYREGQNPASTIEKLLGPDPKLQPRLDRLRAASKSCGVPYRICEVNSFSGGGRPGVSDTMAAALWVLDYMYTLAANGCGGVNMQTGVNHRGFISSYSPIGDDEQGHYSAKPEYYGMLAFALGGAGELLETETDAAPAGVKVYATRPAKGGLMLTLVNKGAAPVAVSAAAPGTRATAIRLAAPAVDAKSGVTLAGVEVGAGGIWKPDRDDTLPVRGGRLAIEIPAASAVVVNVH